MKTILHNLFYLLLLLVTSCGFVEEKKITGNYYAIANDTHESRTLSYKINDDSYVGIVEACLHSVGISDHYLIAVQSPEYSIAIDSSMLKYFIVSIKEEYTLFPEEGIVGPLTKKECLDSAAALGIKKISWKTF
ncbi:hypothetical protein D3C72_716470 [compost metagenome]